ncbi:MAG: protein kinase [Acidobacteriota bacterium]
MALPNDQKEKPRAPETIDARLVSDNAAATTGTPAGPGESSTSGAAPVRDGEHWGKYVIERVLGAGGIGIVYKAYDTQLQRHVALKQLRADDPTLIERFLREARSQAKVQHEHVCQIHEVGEHIGKPYIAMQYVDGETLLAAGREMTLEQKARTVQMAAEALHEAHKLGLVHRDVKPENIMVERSPDGQWRPYVMDFGLAREVGRETTTVAGSLIGTPLYMAPEQVRGETSRLDRRTDVYALGATMYELFSGQPPHEADTTPSLLLKIVEEEPERLRKRIPSIPADLEAVVMRCLEKDPAHRYDSAKALAEDIGRYLSGEPVRARRVSGLYLLSKRVRRHKWAVGASATAALIVAALVAALLWTRWQTAERVRLAKEFGQAIERVESSVKRAYMLPLHDVSYARKQAEQDMGWIRQNMSRLGGVAQGAGECALGRGYLVLGDYSRALEHLSAAWGRYQYRESEAAYSLGLATAEIYRQKAAEATQIRQKDAREARLKQLDEQYRKPALQYVAQVRRGFKEREAGYLTGLLKYLERDYEASVRMLAKVATDVPALYEADILAGDAYAAMGKNATQSGDHQRAAAMYAAAQSAYDRAVEKARSDASVYTRICSLQVDLMGMRVDFTGESPAEPYQRAVGAFESALRADPRREQAWVEKARCLAWWGTYQSRHGEDARDTLRVAVEAAARAESIEPSDESPPRIMGLALNNLAMYEMEHGMDPVASWQRAIGSYQKAIELSPGSVDTRNGVGVVYGVMASYQLKHGQDPSTSWRKAIESFEGALSIDPKYTSAYNGLGIVHRYIAARQMSRGEDPRAELDKARESLEAALRINRNFPAAWNSLGIVHDYLALYASTHGDDPFGPWQKAIESYEAALRVHKDDWAALANLGVVYTNRAVFQISQGVDPADTLQKAIANHEATLGIDADNAGNHSNLGGLYVAAAEYSLLNGRDPESLLRKARMSLDTARRLDPRNAVACENLGKLELIAARWSMARGRDPRRELESSRAWLRKSIDLNEKGVDAHFRMAETYRREAEWLMTSYGKSIVKSASKHAEALQSCIRDGLAAVQSLQSLSPRDPATDALAGALLLADARSASDASRRADLLRQAEARIGGAIQINRFLGHEYTPLLAECRKLLAEGAGRR